MPFKNAARHLPGTVAAQPTLTARKSRPARPPSPRLTFTGRLRGPCFCGPTRVGLLQAAPALDSGRMATPSRAPSRFSPQLARDVLAISLHESDTAMGGDAPPEWVHLIPAGTFSGRDGRGPYTLDASAAQAVLDAFARHGADLPIDYEHQSLTATDKAGPVPAAGWIKALDLRADGLWAQVAWTPQAAALLAAREYRYLSPVFLHRKDGAVVELVGAGLTHTPNLHLRAAAARQLETHTVDELLERLIYMLNLPVTATGDEVVAELQKLIDRLTSAEAAAQAAQSRQPDPAEWVPVAQHRAVAEQLAALQAAQARAAAETAVTAAMRAGKLAPAMKDWALGYASKDPDGFAAWSEKAPVILPPDQTAAHSVAPNAGTDAALTEEDRIACALLGMSETEFATHKQELARA